MDFMMLAAVVFALLVLVAINFVAYLEIKEARTTIAACEAKLWTASVDLENRTAELVACKAKLSKVMSTNNDAVCRLNLIRHQINEWDKDIKNNEQIPLS